ncbi:MAG: hypothetical protein FJX71_00880 [Alphaproteobacteria bacterium]|nr:hypothetical protein [Alphaproteobacteria bacterium]
MDTLLYELYKTFENTYLVVDIGKGGIYGFPTFDKIIEAFDAPKGPKFPTKPAGPVPPKYNYKINIFEKIPVPKYTNDPVLPPSFYWAFDGYYPARRMGEFEKVGRALLEQIQTSMCW